MEQLEQDPATSSGGARSVVAFTAVMVLGLTLVLSPLIVLLWPSKKEAVATYRPTVEVQDEAGVLDSTALSDKLKNLEFRKQVHVAVLTVPGEDVSNLNDSVLEYARSHEGDTDVPWISTSNPKYWSDGLVILAVAPDSRKVGCYFGEDVKVMSSQETGIQDAAKSQFQQEDWAGGLFSMGSKSTEYVGRPRSDLRAFFLQLSFPVAGIGAAGVGVYLWRGLTARRRAGEAQRHYSQVAHDYRATEQHAQRIPAEESHGAQVMARYRWFRGEYESLARSWQDFGSPRGTQWFGLSMLQRATDLRRRSAALDTLDDVVANTATFLNQDRGWEQAWYNEQGPVLEDLQALTALCQQIDSSGRLPVNTMGTREKVRWFHERLYHMTMDLSAGRLQPSQALDELDRIADATHGEADGLARYAIDVDTSRYADERRRRFDSYRSSGQYAAYSGSWSLGGSYGKYDPHATIRVNSASPAIAGLSGFGNVAFRSFAPVSSLVTGYSSASTFTPGGGSSGGGGFSGGGGGFSGAGSSSSF